MNHKTKLVTLIRKVRVDVCLAKEIEELNNIHNVQTLHCCCNHEKGKHGYIIVHEHYERKMRALGYDSDGRFMETHGCKINTYTSFVPKTACTGMC